MKKLHLLALGALVVAYGLGPMTTQMLTPAVPFVHQDFGIPMSVAQALISLSFVTIAVMTLIFGPFSDRFGRRPVILTGTGLFCIGSVVAGLAPTPELLIVGRIVQAAGSATGLALTRTIILDVYGRERSGQVIAYLTTFMIFVPMLSPGVGGVLLDYVSWRALFGVCALFGVMALSLLFRYLPETNHERRVQLGLRETFVTFGSLLRDRSYLGPALFFAFIMASFFATQAAIPYLMVDVLGSSATEYGVWFAVVCAVYVAANYISGRWGDRFERSRLILFSGFGCLATAVAGLVAANVLACSTALLFVPTIALSFFGAIAIAPVQVGAIAAQPQRTGSASGLMTAVQMVVGAVVVQLIGFSHDGTPYPMFATLIACAMLALLAIASAHAAARQRAALSAVTG
ncbi:MAG: Bcr/CflA family efflux MFS transporter [Acidiferrobacterales bacterium]